MCLYFKGVVKRIEWIKLSPHSSQHGDDGVAAKSRNSTNNGNSAKRANSVVWGGGTRGCVLDFPTVTVISGKPLYQCRAAAILESILMHFGIKVH